MHVAPTGRAPGPRRSGLLVLVLASFALIATSPAPARLEASAIGEVELTSGVPVDQTVDIRLEPGVVDDADHGGVRVVFLAASGLDVGYSSKAAIDISRDGRRGAPLAVGGEKLPLAECAAGCDLEYIVRVIPGSGVLPGSMARYRVDLAIQYEGYGGGRPSMVTIVPERPASGPAPAWWAALAGLTGTLLGWALSRSVDRALGPRRRWPATILAALPVAALVAMILLRVGAIPPRFDFGYMLFFLVDPWSLGLLSVLSVGVVRGIRRMEVDGGWSLGLGALAMTGLGGLWLGWSSTLEPVGQPILAASGAALLGLLAGTVIGQGWRTDPRAAHDRLPAGAAVLGHGVVIAGFAFLADTALADPMAAGPALLPLIPAGLIALALYSWFRGHRAWLILFDLLVAGTGLLGLRFVVLSSDSLFSAGREQIGDVAIVIAVVSSLVALVTAFHRMPGPAGPATTTPSATTPSGPVPPTASLEPAPPIDASPPTT